MTAPTKRPGRLAGHQRQIEPVGEPGPRGTAGGWACSCACGWKRDEPARTHDLAEAVLSAHLAEARASGIRYCSTCQTWKPLAEMAANAPHLCRDCLNAKTRAWAAENPSRYDEQHRRSTLLRKYGITPEQYDEMWAAQDGRCAICRRPPQRGRELLDIDHDHETGDVRGLLCWPCNSGLGSLGDDVERVRAALAYLERALPLSAPTSEESAA